MGEMVIRGIKVRDVRQLLATERKTVDIEDEVLGISEETLRGILTKYRIASILSKLTGRTDERCLVGEVGETPIGTVAIQRRNEAWYISSLMVHPDYQGKGYGRALLNGACTEISRLGGKRAILHVRSDNEPAKKLYLSSGFEFFEREVVYTRKAQGLEPEPLPPQYLTQKIGRFDGRALGLVDACREPASFEIYGPTVTRGLSARMIWYLDIRKKFERYAVIFGDRWIGLFESLVPYKTDSAFTGLQLLKQYRGKLERALLVRAVTHASRLKVSRVVIEFDERFTELEKACEELGFQLGFRQDGMVKRLSE